MRGGGGSAQPSRTHIRLKTFVKYVTILIIYQLFKGIFGRYFSALRIGHVVGANNPEEMHLLLYPVAASGHIVQWTNTSGNKITP